MNIICFLTLRPNKLFYDFCKTLIRPDYEVYICIDDNSYDIPSYDNIIKIIKIDNQECIDAGFKSTVLYFQNQACSRDKALYYFSKNNIDYKYIWFIEEDVFLPTSDVINNLDDKYHDADLLCRSNIINSSKNDWQLWYTVNNKYVLPWYCSMVCCCRISNQLLEEIGKYVEEKRYNKKIKARELWDAIISSQIETGVPYMLYKDAANEKSNQKNIDTIKSSNLCVSGDTMVLTKEGYYPIKNLENSNIEVWNGKNWSKTMVKKTGENQKLLTIKFSNGMELKCTEYHKFYIEKSKRPSEKSRPIIV
jgi:hypothetical protein